MASLAPRVFLVEVVEKKAKEGQEIEDTDGNDDPLYPPRLSFQPVKSV